MKPELRIADDLTGIDRTLAERGAAYGDFYEQASLSCAIKAVFHRGKGWQRLAPDQQEAMDFFAVKIARILTGNPDHFDSWHDLVGYAQLVANRLEK